MKYRIRLWDFDGTLADTGRDVWNSIQYAAKKCGGEIDRDYMKKDSNLGKPLAEIPHGGGFLYREGTGRGTSGEYRLSGKPCSV